MAISRKASISKDFNKIKTEYQLHSKDKANQNVGYNVSGCGTTVVTYSTAKNQQVALEYNYEINVLNLLEALAFVCL